MKFNRNVTHKSYAIEISEDDFVAIDTYEQKNTSNDPTLAALLDKNTTARSVDYNGHFGTFIYLTLDVDEDTLAEWKAIETIIADYIKKAKKWITKNNKRNS